MKRAAFALALAATALPAHAGRPLSNEDADVLEDKACQVEAWIDRSRVATQSWLVPACNFGGGIEWQAGFARGHEAGESFYSESYVQAKKVIVAPRPQGWGYGIVGGVARFPTRATRRHYDDPYAIVPITFMLRESTLIHVNAGWLRNRESASNSTLWGVAGEHAINDRVALVAETFGVNNERPFLRAGARVTARKGLDLDFTVVTRRGGTTADRYVSLGLTWQSVPFMP